MKSIASRFIAAAIALIAISVSTTTAQAAPKLDGFCGFLVGPGKTYYRSGAAQTGRFSTLGAGYYQPGILYCDKVSNTGIKKTGVMSLELWAMRYYGATSGSVVMTLGAAALQPLQSRLVYTVNGKAKVLNSTNFGSVHLFEYTSTGWKFRGEQSKTTLTSF